MRSLCFVVESGTDVRLVEGLAKRFNLSVVARRIQDGVEISHPPSIAFPIIVGPAARIKFALLTWKHLRAHRRTIDQVIVQGYGLAALAANLAGRFNHVPTVMLVCSPVEAYYRCRKTRAHHDKRFLRRELFVLQALARINALVGRRYVVLSNHLATVVRQHGTRGRVAVIPVYGVATGLFKPSPESKT